MTRVGLARTKPGYRGLRTPWVPGKAYPELTALLGLVAGRRRPILVY